MTTPPPPHPPVRVTGQPPYLAGLAELLVGAAEDLWDAATLDDSAQMYEDARRAASRVLAACPLD
ncbi:MAG: hypothetical protein WAN35_10880 [Terracidiphilus sp.]